MAAGVPAGLKEESASRSRLLLELPRRGIRWSAWGGNPRDRNLKSSLSSGRGDVRVVLGYYDAEASRQRQIAGWVAGALSPMLRAGPPLGVLRL